MKRAPEAGDGVGGGDLESLVPPSDDGDVLGRSSGGDVGLLLVVPGALHLRYTPPDCQTLRWQARGDGGDGVVLKQTMMVGQLLRCPDPPPAW